MKQTYYTNVETEVGTNPAPEIFKGDVIINEHLSFLRHYLLMADSQMKKFYKNIDANSVRLVIHKDPKENKINWVLMFDGERDEEKTLD